SCLLIGEGRKIFVEKIYANNSVFPTVSSNLLTQGQVTLPHRLEVTLPRFVISQLIIQIPHVVTSRQVAVYATGRGNQENDIMGIVQEGQYAVFRRSQDRSATDGYLSQR